MNENEIKAIAEKAQMIVCGYAFSQTEEGFIRVVNLHAPHHALVMSKDGKTIETNMDDIEISIVGKYWNRNKKTLDKVYA
mgnify:CR=1 FL=1